MLYSEFLNGTGANDTEYNYTVYKNLEALYMANDKLTKEDIYRTGKQLVNNEPSEATKAAIAKAENEIQEAEKNIQYYKERIEVLTMYIEISTAAEAKIYREDIKRYKAQIKEEKKWIDRQKFFLRIA